jgi:PAS domain S-box-containing protein
MRSRQPVAMAHDNNLQHRVESDRPADLSDLFGAAVRHSRTPMMIADIRPVAGAGRVLFANDAFLALSGYTLEEVVARGGRILDGPDTDAAELERMDSSVAAGEAVRCELLSYRKDGSTFWNAMQVSPICDEAGKPTHWLGICADVTERKAREAGLAEQAESLSRALAARAADVERALAQKTTLLHEVDHRVKNNLQLISSLLLLQSRRIEDETARLAVRGMLDRVSAVATVHRRLFQNDEIARFDVAEFMRDLVADLVGAAGRRDLTVHLDLERIEVPSSQAAPLALLLNELLTNVIRHAYRPGEGGPIYARLTRDHGDFVIEVSDRGRGLPDPEAPPRGFGLTIVQLLSEQLRAQTRFADAQPGLRATVRTPLTQTISSE